MPSYVMSIWGPEKSTKSTVGLSAPKPLWHADFDMGFERAMRRFIPEGGRVEETKDGGWGTTTIYDAKGEVWIESHKYPTPFNVTLPGHHTPLKGFKETWYKFLQDYLKGLQDTRFLTTMIDTGTQCWQICHMGFLQEKQEAQLPLNANQKLREKLIPIEYAEPNSRMQAVEQAGKAFGKNLIITHYQTDVYGQRLGQNGIEEYRTGEYKLDGFSRTANLSDVVLRMKVDNEGGIPTPKATVTVCGLSLNLVGVTLPVATWDGFLDALEKMG